MTRKKLSEKGKVKKEKQGGIVTNPAPAFASPSPCLPLADGRNKKTTVLSPKSWVTVVKNAVTCDATAFRSCAEVLKSMPATPNPMNPKTFLRRRQGTFGAAYEFGSQTSPQVGGDDEEAWPELVRRVLRDARERDPSPETLKAVHANFYPDGAGVGRHDDKDGPFDHSKPIYSYTFLSDASRPRDFLIYDARREGRGGSKKRAREDEPFAVFTLEHGSLLTMEGAMQSEFQHEIKSIPKTKFAKKPHVRLNFTVRHLSDSSK